MKKNLLKKIIACAVIATTLISSTVYASSWSKVGNNWNLLNDQGEKLTGWQSNGGQWYYIEQDGTMKIGWKQINNAWYYLQSNGAMKTGWLYDGGKWYYLNPNGDMGIGWKQVGTKWYYLNPNGDMAFSTTIQGYTLGSDGAWITDNGTFNYDANLTSQWRAKYSQNKYTGVAFNKFEDVLKAFAEGKTTEKYIQGWQNPPKDKDGIPYIVNNDPYALGKKVWFDPVFNDWTIIGARGVSAYQVTVKGTNIDDIYNKAISSGIYYNKIQYDPTTSINYDEVAIYKNSTTGEVTIYRLLLNLGKTTQLDNSDMEPGYVFP